MKLRSFRLRIALFSSVLAGTALLGFALAAWRLLYVEKLGRLDARLEYLVKRTVRPRSPVWWRDFENSLPRDLATEPDTPISVIAIDRGGDILYRSTDFPDNLALQKRLPPVIPSNTPITSPADVGVIPRPKIYTIGTGTGSWRVGAVSSTYARGAIAVSLRAIDGEMEDIGRIFALVIPGTLAVIAGGAWFLAGKALGSIARLSAEMERVTVTGLDRRVSIGATDIEFAEPIRVFNSMLERLERSFQQASRFSGDAAHELKTPLAILQGELERAIARAEPGSSLQQDLSALLDEVIRLNGIVGKLLLLSLADSGRMIPHEADIDLAEILAVILEDIELLAPDLKLETAIPESLPVRGDRDLLSQVLQNLLANAVKYNLPDGWIKVRGRREGKTARITVVNASKTIPESDRERIFDRFYRGDPARTRKVEGVGLGLSLAREIARSHRGELTLDLSADGETAFTLHLPTIETGI